MSIGLSMAIYNVPPRYGAIWGLKIEASQGGSRPESPFLHTSAWKKTTPPPVAGGWVAEWRWWWCGWVLAGWFLAGWQTAKSKAIGFDY